MTTLSAATDFVPLTELDLAAELSAVETLTLAELRQRWSAMLDKPVPKVRRTLLAMALAWELQAQVHGGLPLAARQRLAQLAGGRTRTVTAEKGTRLVREWKGKLHTVIVGDDGTVQWDGRAWRSLSEVARAITGTRWSGPAFFGLKQKVGKAA